MDTAKWFKLTPDDVAPDSPTVGFPGGVLHSASPYNVPLALRAYVEDDSVVIEFQYIAPEDTVCDDLANGVTLCRGKNSGRIYSLTVHKDCAFRADVYQRLRAAVEDLTHRSGLSATAGTNYAVAKRALERRGKSALEAACEP